MKDKSDRAAELCVAVCLARNDEVVFEAELAVPGTIATELRGSHGFGYDPVFIGEKCGGSTYAELDGYRKNLRSHRKQALKSVVQWLASDLSSAPDGWALH